MTENPIRCEVCGKFISYAEIENDLVTVDYTPDTEHTIECTEFTHIKCQQPTKTQ
jgi:hypothetical protein